MLLSGSQSDATKLRDFIKILKLPAQLFPELKSGIKVEDTKSLNGTYKFRVGLKPQPYNESFAFFA
jgi:hypothetical protein